MDDIIQEPGRGDSGDGPAAASSVRDVVARLGGGRPGLPGALAATLATAAACHYSAHELMGLIAESMVAWLAAEHLGRRN